MGVWGTKLYQDDFALDVKDTYESLLKQGKANIEIVEEIIKTMESIDEEEITMFWCALADVQWKYGRLLPEIKEKAIEYIDSGLDLVRWEEDKKQYEHRKKVLMDLKEKLNLTQPLEKKIIIRKSYKCEWEIGDVYGYKLESDLAKEKGLYGKYLLFYKSGERSWHPEHIIPLVRIKMTNDETIPKSKDEFERLEYMQLGTTSYEMRYWPITNNKEEMEERKKRKYKTNQYGELPKFQLALISTSKKIIPNKVFFIGNYTDVKLPENEFIPYNLSFYACSWKDLEKRIIDSYTVFTLRQDIK